MQKIEEKDKLLLQQERTIEEKDELLLEQQESIKEKDQRLSNIQLQLNELTAITNGCKSKLKEKENKIIQKTNELNDIYMGQISIDERRIDAKDARAAIACGHLRYNDGTISSTRRLSTC